jgi:hypothetical protein
VYGRASDELENWCHRTGLALRVLSWERAHENAGLQRDALYLLRPDGYVALADGNGRPEVLQQYFREHGYLRFTV